MAANAPTSGSLWNTIDLESNGRVQVFAKPLEKSPNDDRQYRIIRLANNLEALLVHDPDADKAAASLDVAVGSLSDPDDMPGLAHFCEHLLFMGTDKYPKENDYAEYIQSNGGSTNAFTAPSSTNYFFSVAAPALSGAISRFASFFYCPLFLPSCTLRELQAVDSEHKKNQQQDGWRLFQLGKGLSRNDHPWRKFASGNRETLLAAGRQFAISQKEVDSKLARDAGNGNGLLSPESLTPQRAASPALSTHSEAEPDGGVAGRETRRRLLEWWEANYCSSRMKLAIVGRESLDDLTRLVAENFSSVPHRNSGPPLLIDTPPLGPDQMGTVVFAKTIMDLDMIEIAFGVPYQYPHYEHKPMDVLSHLIGHEGPGSIHAFLKNKGWLVSLECSSQPLGRGFDVLRITMSLTKEGVKHWRDVIVVVYNYITVLKSSSFKPYIAEEIRQLADIRFRYKEKKRPDKYATELSELLQRPYPRERVLSAASLVWSHDAEAVRHLLDGFGPRTGRIMVMGRDMAKLTQDSGWEKEKWYGTEYKVQRLEDSVLAAAEGPNQHPELHLPHPNPFIPENLAVIESGAPTPMSRPYLIHESPNVSLWHKKDDLFLVPKAHVVVGVRNPVAYVTPQQTVLTYLVCELVTDSLTEWSYDASIAGLVYKINSAATGFQIAVTGYNDKIARLLQTVVETLAGLKPNPERLSVLTRQLEQDLDNFKMEQPYTISDHWCRSVLQLNTWTKDQLLSTIRSCSLELVESHARALLSTSYAEILVHGNIDKEGAISLGEIVEGVLNRSGKLDPSERPTELSTLLPKASNFILAKEGPNPKDINSSLTYYCHVGDSSDRQKLATLQLFGQIAREPAFDQLRTKEQLGYVVGSSPWAFTRAMGWRVVVQSERDPSYLESRVDSFLKGLGAKIASTSEAEFETQKKGLISELLDKPKNLGDEASRFWSAITAGHYDFTRRVALAAHVEKLKLSDLTDLYATHIDPRSMSRQKLSVHCKSQQAGVAKLSVEAAEAFCDDLKEVGATVDEKQFLDAVAKEPPLELVVAHWRGELERQGIAEEVREKLISQLQRHAEANGVRGMANEVDAEAELDGQDSQGIPPVFVEDMVAFKAGLEVSGPPIPVEGWRVSRM